MRLDFSGEFLEIANKSIKIYQSKELINNHEL